MKDPMYVDRGPLIALFLSSIQKRKAAPRPWSTSASSVKRSDWLYPVCLWIIPSGNIAGMKILENGSLTVDLPIPIGDFPWLY